MNMARAKRDILQRLKAPSPSFNGELPGPRRTGPAKRIIRLNATRALFSALLFFAPSLLLAFEVQVRVYDPVSRKPVPDARVIVKETGQQTYTDGIRRATVGLQGGSGGTYGRTMAREIDRAMANCEVRLGRTRSLPVS